MTFHIYRVARTLRRELVPNALWVDLCHNTLELSGVDRWCWTAVTQGLQSVGQPEMVFTIAGSAGDEAVPEGVLGYLGWAYAMAADGHGVGAGGVSGFKPPGPFGLGSFLGVVFSAATSNHQVTVPSNAVEGVLITEGELEMAVRCGAWRVLSRLGQQARFFPWPFWSDPLRSATYLPGDAERSVLAGSGAPQLGLSRLRLDASLDGNHLDVALSAAEAEQVAESLSALPGVALVPPPDPTSVATLVWSPGQTEAKAISSDPSLATLASARFLMIVPNHGRHDKIRFQEDGFSAILSRKTTKALIRTLREGNEIALGTPNSPSIRFVPR